jgi:hypothetical protein
MIPNGQFHDPAHVEQAILADVDWLRLACIMWLVDQPDIDVAKQVLRGRLQAEIVHWGGDDDNA